MKVKHPMLFPFASTWRHRAPRMEQLKVTPEQDEMLRRINLEIFADMANAGAPLSDILAACYMSGVMHTLSIMQQEDATP